MTCESEVEIYAYGRRAACGAFGTGSDVHMRRIAYET